MNFKYYIPTKILFGRGQLANLHKEKLPGTRALIVTTGGRPSSITVIWPGQRKS